jgi:surface antigen
MPLTILNTFVALILGVLSMQIFAIELDLSLDSIEKSSLTELSESDYKKLKEMAKEALNNSPDGSAHQWANDETGNRGMLTLLSTQDGGETLCRNTEFVNTASGLTSTTLVTICKQENGEWKAQDGSFDTSSEVDHEPLIESTSQSIMVEDNMPESTAIKRKTMEGKGDPDYCRELSETLRTINFNPEAKMDLRMEYKENCLE